MDYAEEWKCRCQIGSVFYPPFLQDGEAKPSSLLLKRRRAQYEEEDGAGGREKAHHKLGPLYFIPNSKTLVMLYSSPDFSPRLPPPKPELDLCEFLEISGTGILPSTASSIAFEIEPQTAKMDTYEKNFGAMLDFNRLQLLPCCGESKSFLAFFSTGENCDRVGYVMICFEDSQLSVKIDELTNKVFMAEEKFKHRILKLSVNPVVNVDDDLSGSAIPYFSVIGYLMACSIHSVHWYLVKTVREPGKLQAESALLEFVGSKSFRSSGVVHCCWSPHLIEESIVLLDNGELYLCNLSFISREPLRSNIRLGRKKLQVLWEVCKDDHNDRAGACWLSCEFSWHPRILVVAHTTAVFLVDARSEGCNVSCLLKIQMLSTTEDDGFIALSRAGYDGFNFCVASKTLLLLCDIRQPWRPLLQWVHNVDNPHYLTVFRLSELRFAQDETYKWASESGSCILLGSFWNSMFGLFIYGPNPSKRSVSSEISKFCNSHYAWGLPAELSLSGHGCNCGSCFLRDAILKDPLPEEIDQREKKEIDWRQKIEIVLGFCVLPSDCVNQLPKPENSSGFYLLRLMSSGKLEGQYYSAAWKPNMISSEAHLKSLYDSDIKLFDDTTDHVSDCDWENMFEHIELDYLMGHLNGNLAQVVVEKLQRLQKAVPEEEDQNKISENLETEGSSGLLHNIQPCNDLLGSLPPHFLLTLYKLINEELGTAVEVLSADSNIKLLRDSILEIAEKHHHGHGISLSIKATDESSHSKPGPLLEVSAADTTPINSGTDDKRFRNLVFRKPQDQIRNDAKEITGLEQFDAGCPLELKFNNSLSIGQEETKLFKLLKKQDLDFQKEFTLYQEFLAKANLVNQ